ncbi:coiled-coil domain-containing protein [Marinomonas posidonica]|uniref:Uncharacterized protein n=1 Tax=Marinomonas posidonica (strain CECT 7376 / NCIMB 14433 / IVIA-Po-181) TaxID=491952 RepID=F6D104_MARPP|nr:hypothetical protein [Marinomonas posidonica]AEF53727.1 hypothetical protein Mar181_0671 [Marinomonas posidonica IVIA-Po-181]
MLVWQWGLIATSVMLAVVFVVLVVRYLSLRKQLNADEADNDEHHNEDNDEPLTDSAQTFEKEQWLVLLKQQKLICGELLNKLEKEDFQGRASLSCWSIFLDVEMKIIEEGLDDVDVISLLSAFKNILDKIDKAQEIDALLKSLKVNQSVLRELNKIIQKTGDKIFNQVNITTDLNTQLDKLQAQLAKEAELDESLGLLRSEIASMFELAERLKRHLDDVKKSGVAPEYIEALEDFLGGVDESDFLNSVGSEMDDKVADLKQLAANQKAIIEELKMQMRQLKGDGNDRHIGEYDISIARLEKSLLESSRVIKRLESKLENLHNIKHNLNIDLVKRDEALAEKTAQLANSDPTGNDIYSVIDEELSTMRNMEDLLSQGGLTEASDAFATEQASKIKELRQMVNDSELYVEVLERDLEKARVLRESLEYKLSHPESLTNPEFQDSDVLLEKELDELENLREINDELEAERKRLTTELYDGQAQTEEFSKLRHKVDELDKKIDSVQQSYVEMEEKYLNAMMAGEDGL